MLERLEGPGGVVIYRSRLLAGCGVRHGFSTRHGGVSTGEFASLNLGLGPNAPESERENLRENLRRFCRAVEIPSGSLVRVKQIHGDRAVPAAEAMADSSCEADALISRESGLGVAVRTADCVPLLVCSRDGRCVAAIHAGWRGLVAGVIPRTLKSLNVAAYDLFAAVGPAIGPEAFEVGEEVTEAFAGIGRSDCVIRSPQLKPRIDLPAAARLQLLEGGLPPAQIDATDRCTHRDREDFFSHRRDRGRTGRLLAAIAPR